MDKMKMNGRLALDTTGSKHQVHWNVVVILAIMAPEAPILYIGRGLSKISVASLFRERIDNDSYHLVYAIDYVARLV